MRCAWDADRGRVCGVWHLGPRIVNTKDVSRQREHRRSEPFPLSSETPIFQLIKWSAMRAHPGLWEPADMFDTTGKNTSFIHIFPLLLCQVLFNTMNQTLLLLSICFRQHKNRCTSTHKTVLHFLFFPSPLGNSYPTYTPSKISTKN